MVKLAGSQHFDGLTVVRHPPIAGLNSRSLRLAATTALVGGVLIFSNGTVQAACAEVGTVVTCATPTVTVDTTSPATPGTDRNYAHNSVTASSLTVDKAVTGFGLAISNAAAGIGVTVVNNASISVDVGNAPSKGGTAALNIGSAGALDYSGSGTITNLGTGAGLGANSTGSGIVTIVAGGDVSATAGFGLLVRDTAAGGNISVTAAGVGSTTTDAVNVLSQSSAGNVTIVTNGTVTAANAGIVGALFGGNRAGNVEITSNGAINARFGIDAEQVSADNKGNTTVKAVGSINTTTGNGIFAQAGLGNVVVEAGDVTSTGATAIIAKNIGAANTGTIDVTVSAGKIVNGSGSGIQTNSGLSSGLTTVNVNGEVIAGAAGTGVKGTSTAGGITINVGAAGKIDPLIGTDLTTATGALTVNNAGIVIGTDLGVQLKSTGAAPAGDLTIAQTGTGSIEGTAKQGINIETVDAKVVITGNGATTTIKGGTNGIEIAATGKGAISIADNTIQGGKNGIVITHTGTAGISVTGTGDIKGTAAKGVDVSINNAANASNIVVNRGGDIAGATGGVSAIITKGTGGVSVTTLGNVTATNGGAIAALQNDFTVVGGPVSVITAAGKPRE